MTVAELINILGEFPQDLEVIISRDGEGNGYNPLYQVEVTSFYEGETIHPEDEDDYPDCYSVVCLWP